MTYSLDFRKKVLEIKEKEGLGLEETADRFGIGRSSISRWLNNLEPQKTRNKPATKIDMEALAKDVELYPDAYQYERAERLGVKTRTVCGALKRLKVTYKKKPKTSKSSRKRTACLPG